MSPERWTEQDDRAVFQLAQISEFVFDQDAPSDGPVPDRVPYILPVTAGDVALTLLVPIAMIGFGLLVFGSVAACIVLLAMVLASLPVWCAWAAAAGAVVGIALGWRR